MSTHQAHNPNSLFHQDDPNRDPNRIRPLNFFPSGTQPTRPNANPSLAPAFEYAARASPATDDAIRAALATDDASRAADEATPPAVSDHLTIGLTNGDSEMTFKVRKTIRMKRIMDQYAERSGRSRPALRFLIDGVRVNDEDTPDSLDMEDGDVVEVHQEQIGGYRRMMSISDVQTADATPPPVTHLTISLIDSHSKFAFKVKPIIKMKRVMDEFAARKGRSRPALRFLLDGQTVHDNDTPESLGMVDGGEIMVHIEYTGGLSDMPRRMLSISVKDGNDERFYKIASTTQMKFLLEEYAKHKGKSRSALRFSVEGLWDWVERIQDTDTPEFLGLADGDIVEVHSEQIGGLSSMLSSLVVE